jgi:transposase InsO family protein
MNSFLANSAPSRFFHDAIRLFRPRLYPFTGSRMLRDLLRGEAIATGRDQVTTMMRRMAIEAVYRRQHTSKSADGHRVFPYLLRGVAIERPNQAWAMDVTYIPMPVASCTSPR